ncbi:hypothetical protein [Nocardia seriolae]|uniref:hypothetical protein n=1 Tax=Nocardia seriolae TaxID=37332 RepID=UPI000A5BBF8A|nr:hypothetical protein [Nocardia seriolae]
MLPYLESGEDMLMVAFNAELDRVSDRIELVLSQASEERIRDVLRVGYEKDLFVEALTFLGLLSDETLTRIAEVAAGMDTEVLAHMVISTQRENAWAELVPVAAAMPAGSLAQFLKLDVWNAENLSAIAAAAERDGRFEELWQRAIEASAELG